MVMSLVLMVRAKKGISLSTPLFELPYPYQDFSLSRFSRRAAAGSDEDDDIMKMIMRLKHLGKLSEKQILLMMKNIHHLAWYWVATWRPVRWLLPEK